MEPDIVTPIGTDDIIIQDRSLMALEFIITHTQVGVLVFVSELAGAFTLMGIGVPEAIIEATEEATIMAIEEAIIMLIVEAMLQGAEMHKTIMSTGTEVMV